MFHIISDSACDLADAYIQEHDVTLVPLYVTVDGVHYLKDRVEMKEWELYRLMVEEHVYPKTSLASVEDFADVCRPFVAAGEPVVMMTISTHLSGCYNSARMAKEVLLEEYPDAQIAVIDSLQNTVEQGLYVNEAVRMRDDGVPFDVAVEKLLKMRSMSRIFFTIGSLEYMKKNGRIGKLAVLAGDKLGIRPIIVLNNGEVTLGGVARTRKKSVALALQSCKKFFGDNHLNKEDYTFCVGYGYDVEEGKAFIQTVEQELGVTCVHIGDQIGIASAVHTGPYPLGIGVMPMYEIV